MKRHILLCFFAFCTGFLLKLDAQTISCKNFPIDGKVEVRFTNPHFQIQDTTLPVVYNTQQVFSWINVDDEEFGIVDSAGMPCLPQITFNINLPENAVDIALILVDSTEDYVHLNKQIVPYQNDFSAEDTHSFFPFTYNQTFYNSNTSFIHQSAIMTTPYKVRDKLGISITIFPYEYTPYSNELRVLNKLKLIVKYNLNGTVNGVPASSVFEDYYLSFFKNYSPVTSNLEPPRYLIVTPECFYNDVQPFADYKESIGYEVDVIPIEPEDMSSDFVKSIIYTRYQSVKYRPDYVLLIGDSTLLPPAQGYASGTNENNPITDLPYVLLEGNDLEQDAFIGRWPIIYSDELHNIIRKTIYMEMNMQQLDKRALFVSGDHDYWLGLVVSFMRWTFETAQEYAIEETFEPEGYTCEMRYQPYLQTVRNWMAWNPLVFAYSGHGSFTSMGPLSCYDSEPSSYIVENTLDEFNNDIFPMVFSFACKTGNYAHPSYNNIGELWLRNLKGGVTFYGSSVSTLNTSDIVMEKKIFGEAFFDANKPSIGKVIALGKRRFRNHFLITNAQAERFSKSYNLMGDPSFLIRGLNCPPQYIINEDNIVRTNQKEYHAAERIEIGDVLIDGTSELGLSAGDEIVFVDGFETSSGAEVEAWVESCGSRDQEMFYASSVVDYNDTELLSSMAEPEPSSFSLYPNPANNEVTIQFNAGSIGIARVIIYNMHGTTVYEKEVPIASVGIQSVFIPLEDHIPTGNYIVSLFVDNQTFSNKLIIQ